MILDIDNRKIRRIPLPVLIGMLTFIRINSGFAAPPEPDAIIIEVEGNVIVKKTASEKERPANLGMKLASGDLIRTGNDGHAILLFANGTRIDLFSNSQIQIKKHLLPEKGLPGYPAEKTKILSQMWGNIKNKFDDTEFTGAQAGRVGTLRGDINESDPENMNLSPVVQKKMREEISVIESEKLPRETGDILCAIIFEQYEQYKTAESFYLELIKNYPDNPLAYTMLIDLYLKIDLYGHARKIQDIKNSKVFR